MRHDDSPLPDESRRVSVVIAGETLDFVTAPALFEAITTRLSPATPNVVVDFSRTSFMDSSGINALLRAHRLVQAAGGWMRLSAVAEPVLSPLQIVGLDEILSIYPTVEAACADAV
ncbi:STAS domain-containing protein [Actinacidiphila acididurans]|uniref:Anti-sigma factor antagonist n=1 Tax=Actinacidiphila acididurans TaxID=2784346 RepID=A0ABS2TI06_9ACTN|nr:STAS domain-containing protein [Actinacidiphila acididurans]MBM9502980.1 STAS domain-containing protein [Actinacidiphila acididurans]